MSKNVKDRITQVMLTRRRSPSSMSTEVCWIESGLAKIGKRLSIEGSPEVWTVSEVYGTREIESLDMQYKAWREFAEKLGG